MPILALLAILAAFPPLAMDMYLPALPLMQEQWGVNYNEVSRSLTLFMLTSSVFLLVHGPLSDKFGRKPVLLGGISIFIVGSGLAALSASLDMFLTARFLQGVGAAAASSLSLALGRDLFDGTQRQKILGYIGVLMVFCPMIAPTVGGLIIKFVTWPWIFVVQILFALVSMYGVYRLKEPVTEFTQGGVLSVIKRYIVVISNVRYTVLAIAFATIAVPNFGFIGGSADIYINLFGLSEQQFGLFFALNAIGFMVGSFTCTRICDRVQPLHILLIALGMMFVAGLVIHALGGTSPWSLAIPLFFSTVAVGFSRPVSNVMILDQVDKDVGAAAGVMTFFLFVIGSFSMEIISLDWANKPVTLGTFALIGASIPLITLFLCKIFGVKIRSSVVLRKK